MLLQLVQWLRAHFQPLFDRPVVLTEEELQPLMELAKALQMLFLQRQLLAANEVALVVEGLLIIAECYVAQRYSLTAVSHQLQFLSQSVQPLLASLETTGSLTPTQAKSYQRRIIIFQGDVLTHQHANWRELVEPPLVAYEQALASLRSYCEGIRLSTTPEEHVEATNKLNQWEAHWLAAKAQPYLWSTLESLQFSTLTDVHASPYVCKAQKVVQLLQRAKLLSQALHWSIRLLTIAVQQQWPSWSQLLANLVQAFQQQKPQAMPLWQEAREVLKQHREHLREQLAQQPSQAMTVFNSQLIQFTQQLWQTSEQLLGPSPVKYCILALGSMSQNMLSAYSDVEYAILTETAEAADWEEKGKVVGTAAHYIKTLCEVFEFKVVSLGESGTNYDERGIGYQLDRNSQPHTEPSLCGTPEQLVESCLAQEIESHDGLVYSLLHAKPLYGDLRLFKLFQNQLQQAIIKSCTRDDSRYLALKNLPLTWHQYWALAQFERNQREYNKYFFDKKELPDLKKPYLKLLRFMVLDLALYLNLPAQDFIQACEQLVAGGYLPLDLVETIQRHVNYLLIERNKLHLVRDKEDDSVLPEHQVRLEQIRQTLFAPYFDTIDILATQGFALWQQAFWLKRLETHFAQEQTRCEINILDEHANKTNRYYLNHEWITRIFEEKGKIKPTVSERNSAVFHLGTLILKIQKPDTQVPEEQKKVLEVYLTRENTVNNLARLLGFTAIPEGCPVKLTYLTTAGKSISYYAWLSNYLEGNNLEEISKKDTFKKNQVLNKIDLKSYSQLFILSLLIYPEDAQPKNYLLSTVSPGKLYSVDNKYTFVDPVKTFKSGFIWKTQHELLNFKCCLYFLPMFYEVVDTSVWRELQYLDLEKIKEILLTKINSFNELISQEIASDNNQANLDFIPYMIQFNLEMLLKLKIPLCHSMLLKMHEPNVFQKYQALREKKQDYYTLFRAEYRQNSDGENFTKTTVELLELRAITKINFMKHLLSKFPEFAMNINWQQPQENHNNTELSDKNYVLPLLKALNLTKVSFANYDNLKANDLQDVLLYSANLQELDITNCKQLASFSDYFLRNSKALKILICDKNVWMQEIHWKVSLPNLHTLSVKFCENLKTINVSQAKRLCYLYTEGTPQDIKIYNNEYYGMAFYRRANTKYDYGNFLHAISDYNEAIYLDPTKDIYFNNRGDAKYNLGRFADAIVDYDQAILLNPNKDAYFGNRGDAKYNLGRFGDAIIDYDQAILLNSHNINYLNNRRRARKDLNQSNETSVSQGSNINVHTPSDNNHSLKASDIHLGKICENARTEFEHYDLKSWHENLTDVENIHFNQLRSIDLSYNKISDEGIKPLINFLCDKNCQIEKLKINRNSITFTSIRSLAEALTQNSTVKVLYLDHVANNGAGELAQMLATNTSLNRLHLLGDNLPNDRQIKAAGIERLVEALTSKNTTLQVLDLFGNHFGNDGAQHIKTLLEKSVSISALGLGWNDIGPMGVESIAQGLGRNTSLLVLSLPFNPIGKKQKNKTNGIEHLAHALLINTTLISLDLTNTICADSDIDFLCEKLCQNHASQLFHVLLRAGGNLQLAGKLPFEKRSVISALAKQYIDVKKFFSNDPIRGLKIAATYIASYPMKYIGIGNHNNISFNIKELLREQLLKAFDTFLRNKLASQDLLVQEICQKLINQESYSIMQKHKLEEIKISNNTYKSFLEYLPVENFLTNVRDIIYITLVSNLIKNQYRLFYRNLLNECSLFNRHQKLISNNVRLKFLTGQYIYCKSHNETTNEDINNPSEIRANANLEYESHITYKFSSNYSLLQEATANLFFQESSSRSFKNDTPPIIPVVNYKNESVQQTVSTASNTKIIKNSAQLSPSIFEWEQNAKRDNLHDEKIVKQKVDKRIPANFQLLESKLIKPNEKMSQINKPQNILNNNIVKHHDDKISIKYSRNASFFAFEENNFIAAPQRYTVQMNQQTVVFEVKTVIGDGDCGYTAFGITREEAYHLLTNKLHNIRHIIKRALQEALRTQAFIDILQREGRLTQALSIAYANYLQASNIGGEMPQSILDKLDSAGEDLTILLAYIEYDVSAKQIDHGWSHPCILFALAEIQNIELHIWQYDEQDELVPHRQHPYHIPAQVTQRTDLLFVNGNHFERLERIDDLSSAEQLSNPNTLKL